jgi:hypothetical protein
LLETKQGKFYIPDPEPTLKETTSQVGGLSLSEHRSFSTLLDIPKWESGTEIQIEIQVEDLNSDIFEVHYQLLHYFLFAADRTVLAHYTLDTDSIGSFIGTYVVPDQPILIPDETLALSIEGEIFLLLFFIRDLQGNVLFEPVFFQIRNSLDFDFEAMITAGLIAIGLMFLVIFLIRRSSRPRVDPYSYYYPSGPSPDQYTKPVTKSVKYCAYCGTQLPAVSRFCSNCGQDQEFS